MQAYYGCVVIFVLVEVFGPFGCGVEFYGVWGDGMIVCMSVCISYSLWFFRLHMLMVVIVRFCLAAILA